MVEKEEFHEMDSNWLAVHVQVMLSLRPLQILSLCSRDINPPSLRALSVKSIRIERDVTLGQPDCMHVSQ
jgi:hypothetical protein